VLTPLPGSGTPHLRGKDTPDEARLALLDLDVTAEELSGKVLRWDSSASAWRPDSDDK
jgi:hypothetical protein